MTEKFVGRVHLLVTLMIVKVIFTTYDIIGVLYIYIYALQMSWVDVMYNKFMAVSGNKLPSLAKCKLAMPACFATHPNTRVILDCTEVVYH